MLRCWNIKEVKLQNAHFFGGKLFWKQVKKQQSTHCHRENISNFRSSEHWEIKCLFGLSKGTVPSHWQSYPYSWGFFRGKKKNHKSEYRNENYKCMRFLNTTTYHPNPPSLLHSLLLPNPHLLYARFPLSPHVFFFVSISLILSNPSFFFSV